MTLGEWLDIWIEKYMTDSFVSTEGITNNLAHFDTGGWNKRRESRK